MQKNSSISDLTAHYLSSLVLTPLFNVHLVKLIKMYFRLQTIGVENIPKQGSALIVPNHSGFAGLDAIILTHEIAAKSDRLPKVMTHFLWFISKTTAIPMKKMGFIEATTENGLSLLKAGKLVVIFPEGEKGNFKPTAKKYQLQEFKRGFVRWAIETQTPIIPTLIVGAEESQINLTQLEIPFFLKKIILPLPINIVPLPSKWKIIFLPAIHLPYLPSSANDNNLVHEITADIQEKMQIALNDEIRARKSIYL